MSHGLSSSLTFSTLQVYSPDWWRWPHHVPLWSARMSSSSSSSLGRMRQWLESAHTHPHSLSPQGFLQETRVPLSQGRPLLIQSPPYPSSLSCHSQEIQIGQSLHKEAPRIRPLVLDDTSLEQSRLLLSFKKKLCTNEMLANCNINCVNKKLRWWFLEC